MPSRPTLATGQKHIMLHVGMRQVTDQPRTIVVLGVERGGTSMVAGVIRAMGISMGPRAGLNHEDPRFLNDDPAKLRPYIQMRNQAEPVWGFKMPKATLNLDFFHENLRNPVFVVAYRNPVAVADSWQQRGAGQPIDVLDRINDYQSAISRFLRQTGAPAVLLSYERAVASPEARTACVDELAQFLRWPATEEQRSRAVAMMTGDGGGYVDLPEHFLAAHPIAAPAAPVVIPTQEDTDPRDDQGWISQTRQRPTLVLRRPGGETFPKRFALKIEFENGENTRAPEGSVRLFFRYTDDFINAHCRRPVLPDGVTWLDVETSGLADAIAMGPWKVPAKYKARITVVERDDVALVVSATSDGRIDATAPLHEPDTAERAHPTPVMAASRPGLARRILARLKRQAGV